MKTIRSCAIAAAIFGAAVGAQASLIDRGAGMVYDTDTNLTWLQDWNYALTTAYAIQPLGFDEGGPVRFNGQMNWEEANAWADQLTVGGFGDWRLPLSDGCKSATPGGGSTSCTGSEAGHLILGELGGALATSPTFKNVSGAYWTGTEFGAVSPAFGAYIFSAGGFQYADAKYVRLNAVAVREGDVMAPVPEPSSLATMLLGIGLLPVALRRARKSRR